jgi:hypothetical protein
MGKHKPPRQKEDEVRDVVRRLTSLSGMDGVPWLEAGRLWLLAPPGRAACSRPGALVTRGRAACSRPGALVTRGRAACSRPGALEQVAERPADPAALAHALLGPSLPDRADFAHMIGARRQLVLDVEAVAGWARDVTELEARRDIEALAEEGVRPLRRYRGTDLRARIRQARQRLERLGRLVQARDPAGRCQVVGASSEIAAEDLVRALPLRLYALGNWAVDPVEELQAPEVEADGLLRQLAGTANDPGVAVLAALLLGIRSRGRHLGPATRSPDFLPGHLAPAFQAGLAGCAIPCLWTLAWVQADGKAPDLGADPIGASAAERMAQLHGVPAALAALDNLNRPLEDLGPLRARLQRFEELVEAHARGRAPAARSAEEADWLRNLSRLGTSGTGAAHLLVELFLHWVGGEGRRLVSRRSLRRVAEAASPRGLAVTARELSRAWLRAWRTSEPVVQCVSRSTQEARLTLALRFPGSALPLPAGASPKALTNLQEVIEGVTAARLQEVWPALIAPEALAFLETRWWTWHDLGELVRSKVPPDLIQRALSNDVLPAAATFGDNLPGLGRYLDCVETLQTRGIPNLDVRAGWFAGLFRTGRPWAPAVVLTLLAQARRKGGSDLPAELFALRSSLVASESLAPAARPLVEAFQEWGSPTVHKPPPQLQDLAALLGPSRLEEYLHHRRLAGHGETFAEALLEPLRQAEQETREAEFLRGRLAAGNLEPNVTARLAVRLARLTDPDLTAARREQATGRALKRLDRSLALLRQESLERILDEAARTYLRDLLGQAIPPGPLPPGLPAALQLLAAQEIDHDLLASFLLDVLHGRPLADRPAWGR